MFDPAKLMEGLKLSPKHLAPVALATGALVFAPQRFLTSLGVSAFIAAYRGWVGVLFLVTASLLATHAVLVPWGGARRWLVDRRHDNTRKRRLEDLTPAERGILSRYMSENTRTLNLDIKSGVVAGLEAEGIIYRAADMGDLVRGFAYNIQPWARDYLRRHESLLDGPAKPATTPPGQRLSRR